LKLIFKTLLIITLGLISIVLMNYLEAIGELKTVYLIVIVIVNIIGVGYIGRDSST